MTRPDPAADLVGSLRWIMERLEEIERVNAGKRVNITEAAKALGYTRAYIYGNPWRIPTFGAEGSTYTLSVWREWLARPEAERRAEWDALGMVERRKIRGVA